MVQRLCKGGMVQGLCKGEEGGMVQGLCAHSPLQLQWRRRLPPQRFLSPMFQSLMEPSMLLSLEEAQGRGACAFSALEASMLVSIRTCSPVNASHHGRSTPILLSLASKQRRTKPRSCLQPLPYVSQRWWCTHFGPGMELHSSSAMWWQPRRTTTARNRWTSGRGLQRSFSGCWSLLRSGVPCDALLLLW